MCALTCPRSSQYGLTCAYTLLTWRSLLCGRRLNGRSSTRKREQGLPQGTPLARSDCVHRTILRLQITPTAPRSSTRRACELHAWRTSLASQVIRRVRQPPCQTAQRFHLLLPAHRLPPSRSAGNGNVTLHVDNALLVESTRTHLLQTLAAAHSLDGTDGTTHARVWCPRALGDGLFSAGQCVGAASAGMRPHVATQYAAPQLTQSAPPRPAAVAARSRAPRRGRASNQPCCKWAPPRAPALPHT